MPIAIRVEKSTMSKGMAIEVKDLLTSSLSAPTCAENCQASVHQDPSVVSNQIALLATILSTPGVDNPRDTEEGNRANDETVQILAKKLLARRLAALENSQQIS